MQTLDHMCQLAAKCSVAGKPDFCNMYCSPFMLLHGVDGTKGLWKGRNVPVKYSNAFLKNLPIKTDNPVPYQWVSKYVANVLENVEKGTGLFFYSVANSSNRLGTGTGKTTAAITILNEFLVARVIEDVQGGRKIRKHPALFYKASEFQNLYNSQFRGTPEMQELASAEYYAIKEKLMNVELLVFDDIGIRTKITDAFENEVTEVIDARDTNQLSTIYTSNLPVEKLADTMGDRIASRIEGMTEPIAFKGKDHRKGGIL